MRSARESETLRQLYSVAKILKANNLFNELYARFISGLRCVALRATLKQLYAAAVTSVNLVDNLYASLTSRLLVAA